MKVFMWVGIQSLIVIVSIMLGRAMERTANNVGPDDVYSYEDIDTGEEWD